MIQSLHAVKGAAVLEELISGLPNYIVSENKHSHIANVGPLATVATTAKTTYRRWNTGKINHRRIKIQNAIIDWAHH